MSPIESRLDEQSIWLSSDTSQSNQGDVDDTEPLPEAIGSDGTMQALLFSNMDSLADNSLLGQPDSIQQLTPNGVEAVLPTTAYESAFMGFSDDVSAFDEWFSMYDGSFIWGLEAFGPTGGISALSSWKLEGLLFSMLTNIQYEGIKIDR
jgi:hypothetical protein